MGMGIEKLITLTEKTLNMMTIRGPPLYSCFMVVSNCGSKIFVLFVQYKGVLGRRGREGMGYVLGIIFLGVFRQNSKGRGIPLFRLIGFLLNEGFFKLYQRVLCHISYFPIILIGNHWFRSKFWYQFRPFL